MRSLLLVLTLIAAYPGTGFAQARKNNARAGAIAIAFFEEGRLGSPGGKAALKDFQFFLKDIQEIVKRDFPNVEFRIVRQGELVRLPDGTGLNAQTIGPEFGYLFAAPGKKRRLLVGVQTDADFACAAAAFFQRSSRACPK